jgi:hypothetical protein
MQPDGIINRAATEQMAAELMRSLNRLLYRSGSGGSLTRCSTRLQDVISMESGTDWSDKDSMT